MNDKKIIGGIDGNAGAASANRAADPIQEKRNLDVAECYAGHIIGQIAGVISREVIARRSPDIEEKIKQICADEARGFAGTIIAKIADINEKIRAISGTQEIGGIAGIKPADDRKGEIGEGIIGITS